MTNCMKAELKPSLSYSSALVNCVHPVNDEHTLHFTNRSDPTSLWKQIVPETVLSGKF